ncbi:hypothetical protein [Streptomyces sp. NBC_01176]|uniref:hypothetical protein n=1 Tax=Streptomyces sp. NBC_01176 TaxID=2903760 RepID=UPI003868C7EF|nr:hypothetical protein OG199_04960 [Streptomyces sp. NBC_01176]
MTDVRGGTFILREVYARALTWTPFALATAGPADLLEAVGTLAHITSMEVTLSLTKVKRTVLVRPDSL